MRGPASKANDKAMTALSGHGFRQIRGMKMNKKTLTILGVGHAVTDISQSAVPMMLAFLQPVLALSHLQVGVVVLALNLFSSVIQPAFGLFSDRRRMAWLIPAGCLLAGLGMALVGFSPGYIFLLAAVMVCGLGVAAYHPEGSKFARLASGSRRASGMAMYTVGGNIGFALGPGLATFFYEAAGLRGTAGFLALNGLMAALLWIYLSEIAPAVPKNSPAGPVNPARGKAGDAAGMSGVALVFPVVLLILVIVMRTWVHFGIVTFLPQYFVNYLHHSNAYAASVVTLFLLCGALGSTVGGPAADRWGLKNIMIVSTSLVIPLLYLFPHVSGIWTLIVVALTGFVLISTFAVTVVFGQELLPNNIGLISGLTLGFAIGMGGVGTTFLGWLADRWGLPVVFKVMVLFPVLGLLLIAFLPGTGALARRKRALSGGE